ncbi:helix-turn-helix domain-containing protein [Amycolatopsis solani]|uniref:helix-turn-helix domain-containing protein n=1 Tax=Amycolatopsis solani TaxID=3028615 RepID=UPI0025B2685B|nr:helix-turn-helix transcriptional regulator [Amycolatopsis sp. MEP2-6]
MSALPSTGTATVAKGSDRNRRSRSPSGSSGPVHGHRLAEIRRGRGFTQQQLAERMGVTKGRVSQIEQGKIAGFEVLARYAAALGGRLHQAISCDDGDVATIA